MLFTSLQCALHGPPTSSPQFDEDHKLWTSSLCNFLQPPAISCLLVLNNLPPQKFASNSTYCMLWKLQWLMFLLVFLIPSRHIPGQHLKTDHDPYIRNPSQFKIYSRCTMWHAVYTRSLLTGEPVHLPNINSERFTGRRLMEISHVTLLFIKLERELSSWWFRLGYRYRK